LSPQHRDILMGSINEALEHYVSSYNSKTMAAWGPKLDERGIQRVTYSDAEIAAFRQKVAGPAAQAWIEENTARGLPAQELYDLVTKLIAEN